jgi:UDP-2,3-diacylglucosamine pyrophosphatase LpxH
MSLFVVSDLHLFDRNEQFLFNAQKEACFARLCEIVLASDSRLICAGDIFDCSGLSPCEYGTREFFDEALPVALIDRDAIKKSSIKRTPIELLNAIKAAFPKFFLSLSSLAKARRLDFIPGNHDCEFLSVETQKVFADTLGVTHEAIGWTRELIFDERVIVRHGNEFDPANQTKHSCKNPGKVFTSALYQCVIPALRMLGVAELTLSAIPAVRPEEATILWLEEKIGEAATKKLLTAFVRLLERNGFFRGVARVPGWFLIHDVPLFANVFRRGVTPARVRSLLPKDEKLVLAARAGAKIVRGQSRLKRSADSPAIVVMGHTHVLDIQNDYVNLGTWIDHISGLSDEHLNQADLSLPVFSYEPGRGGRVFDARALSASTGLSDCRIMGELE